MGSFIKQESLSQLKERANILDVVSPYVQLKRAGAHWKGLSPFSNEKSPSFFVLPEKNLFKCFSSGYAGDPIRFIQLKENLSFIDAVEVLAKRFNVTLQYDSPDTPQAQKSTSIKKELYDIHQIALDYYHHAFLHHADAPKIQDYWLNQRKFSLDAAKKYSIGYAPGNQSSLLKSLIQKNFSLEAIKQSGLFYLNNTPKIAADSTLPRFQGRLQIPIFDIQGRVIAFAGRKTPLTPPTDPTLEAKYINSPESPIFHKGSTLFGLHEARKHVSTASPYFLLVEGQLDTLRCWQYNFLPTIAPQGTAITNEQLSILRRYTHKLYSILDGDAAGQKAALRLLPLAYKNEIEVRFVTLPEDEDPDSLLLSPNGPELFNAAIQKSISPIDFALKSLASTPSASLSPHDKASLSRQLFEIIENSPSSIIIQDSLQLIANALLIPYPTLQSEFERFTKKSSSTSTFSSPTTPSSPIKLSAQKISHKVTTVEYQLFFLILKFPQILPKLAQVFNFDWVQREDIHATLLCRFIQEFLEGLWSADQPPDHLLQDEQEKNVYYETLLDETPIEDPLYAANLCLKTLHQAFYNNQKKSVEHQIAQTHPSDSQKLHDLLSQRNLIRKILSDPPKITL